MEAYRRGDHAERTGGEQPADPESPRPDRTCHDDCLPHDQRDSYDAFIVSQARQGRSPET
jgi:hypothetical protein